MNKAEYLAALAYELRGLPLEEQRSAMQYYEDYFADAGEENESQVIRELGSPQAVAQEILQDFREVAAVPQPIPQTRRGISPVLLVVALVLIILCWPVALGLIGVVLGLIGGILGILIALVCAGLGLCIGGIACGGFGAFTLFTAPLSGLLLLGCGCMMLALGILLTAFWVWLCFKLVPPTIRGIVRLFKKPFEGRKHL